MADEPEAPPPVERPDPALIQRLFDEDPLKLSSQDIDQVIAFFRADRVAYMQQPLEKAKKANEKANKPAAIPVDEGFLKDLGLI